MNEDVTLAKWLNNELSGKELADFEASPEFATYNKIKQYSAGMLAPEANMERVYAKIKEGTKQQHKPKVRQLNTWITRVAAVIVIALGLSFYF
ncbi:MAG: hypothetical protein ACOVRN_09835 [Flavobacterium sp.]